MKFLQRVVILSVFVFVLSGCASTRSPELLSLLGRSTITDVDVEVSKDMSTGIIPGLDGVSDEQRAVMLASALKESLRARLGQLPQGGTPTKLHVTITHVNAASDAGRVLLGNSSFMSGTGELRDIQTGAKLGDLGNFNSSEGAVRGGGLGIPIAIAVNAMTSAQQTRIAALTEPFAERIITALKP